MLKMSSSSSNKGSIPSSVWKTIQHIKEITGNHSDDDVYAMLKDCSMDPNETAHKLIFQDTFHEVKRKRDRRKENMTNKFGESNLKVGTHGRGNKGGAVNNSSRHASHDAGGGRKSIAGKVNGASQVPEKSIRPTSLPCSQAENNNNNTSSSIASPYEPSGVASGPTTGTVAGKLEGPPEHLIDAKKSPKVGHATSDMHGQQMQSVSTSTAANVSFPSSGVNLSASDPVQFPLQDAQLTGVVAIQPEVGNLHAPVENSSSKDTGATSAIVVKERKAKATSADPAQVCVADASSEVSVYVEPNTEVQPMPVVLGTEEATVELQNKLEESHITGVQHVIIPNHLHVPEAEKLGLCFGSFDAIYGLDSTSNSEAKNDKNSPLSETSDANEETAKEQLPSDECASATVDEADYPDPPPTSSSQGQESLSSKGDELSSFIKESDKSNQENVHGDTQYSVFELPPNNHSYAIIPPILGSQLGPESQADLVSRLPNFAGANQLVLTTAAAASHVTQIAGVTQCSVAIPQPPLPVYQQPTGVQLPHYLTNFFPYSHYFSPYFVPPPAMHPFLSNSAFPQQPLAGGVYPPSLAAAAKYPLSNYKQGANVENSTPVGLPSNFGPYGSPMANYNSISAGNPPSNEDIFASRPKEVKVFDSPQQASSFYGLPQNQVAFTPTQPAQGTIAGIFHPVPPVTNPTLHPMLKPSQAMGGPVDMVGPTATVYQHPQYTQLAK